MLSAKDLLDSLMGKNRDMSLEEKKTLVRHFSDDDVCKFYLCGLCPYQDPTDCWRHHRDFGAFDSQIVHKHRIPPDLVVAKKDTHNGLAADADAAGGAAAAAAAVGAGGSEEQKFEDRMKAEWEALPQSVKDKYGYEHELLEHLGRLVDVCDRKITRGKARIAQDERAEETAKEELLRTLSDGDQNRYREVRAPRGNQEKPESESERDKTREVAGWETESRERDSAVR